VCNIPGPPLGADQPSTQRYQLVIQNKDWSSAARHCQALGMDLVTIRSRADQLAVERFLRKDREYKVFQLNVNINA